MSSSLSESQRLPLPVLAGAGRPLSSRQRLAVLLVPALAGLVWIGWMAAEPMTRDAEGLHLGDLLHRQTAAPTAPALPMAAATAPLGGGSSGVAFSVVDAGPEPEAPPAAPAIAAATPALTWAPDPEAVERSPSDHPAVSADVVRVRVVTIQARVTAYTPYDHATTKPEWADGVVAWHPNGRKRHVREHRYGLATDWTQFPPGATYIRIPGYMEQTFPDFPESFRVVDDACGQSRKTRRAGGQPVIDVRFMTRHSAIHPTNGWGSRQLEVEVIYPEDFVIPHGLRRWVVSEAWHTYRNGRLASVDPID